MKLSQELEHLSHFSRYATIAPLLQAAAQQLEAAHLWREAWVRTENRCEELTREINALRSQLSTQKGERT
jgi:DNA-binding winged helix-turn-helix (wHTH) protein